MLGDLVLEEKGSTTGIRVLNEFPDKVVLEVCLATSGTLLGIEHTALWTYHSTIRPDGRVQGEGHGIYTTKDGDVATVRGTGVGVPKGAGSAASWRGALYFYSTAEKLKRLNDVAVVYEYEIDEDGNTEAKGWDWK